MTDSTPGKKKPVKEVKRYPKGSKTPYEGQEILEKQISDTESLLQDEADPIDIINRVVETLEAEQDKEYSRENRKALNSLNDAVKHLTRKQNKKG